MEASSGMATLTATTTTTTMKKLPRLPPERYYLIIKAILSGYGRSSFYHQKLIQDPRPVQQIIASSSGVRWDRLRSDLKHLIDKGLVRCYVHERKRVFSSKKKKKLKAIKTYEVTDRGFQYLEEYDGGGGSNGNGSSRR